MKGVAAVRRCCALFLEPTENVELDITALLSGADPRRRTRIWNALAPHLDVPVVVDERAVAALGRLSATQWTDRADAARAIDEDVLAGLIDAGLVLEEGRATRAHERDLVLRDAQWHPLLATAHVFSRWTSVDSIAAQEGSGIHSTADMIAISGLPPPHYRSRDDAQARVYLRKPGKSSLDELLQARTTCRNFDLAAAVTATDFADTLHRVFGEQGREEIEPGAVALKKNHPSGGGLHPLEAYLLVQRVEGIEPGLYHYNVESHALDRLPTSIPIDVPALARRMVAGQGYFPDAAVMLVFAARFPRSAWKYRKHPKIYRAILLEAGHASQNVYLAATDRGLGAYVTAAINEIDIEAAFGLDPLLEGAIAVCGFGPRTRSRETIELDPAHRTWDERGELITAIDAARPQPGGQGAPAATQRLNAATKSE